MSGLNINVTKPQAEFLNLNCKHPLFVGGFGSGKTHTLNIRAFLDAVEGGPHSNIGIFAPTYDLIRLNNAPRLCEFLESQNIKYNFNKTDNTIYTDHPQVGNFILRSLDTPEKIVGYELFSAHVDELDTIEQDKAKELWNKILGRVRQVPKGYIGTPPNRTCAYTTPEGFKFTYNRWVCGASKDYQRVHVSTLSNPYLPSDYVQTLKDTYPSNLVDAYINGEFVNLTSGNVYHPYNRHKHSSEEVVLPNDVVYIGIDFNVTNMAATVYVRRNEGHEWHIVDEICKVYDTPAIIKIIKENYYMKGHKVVVYPDASGRSRKSTDASTSDIALLNQAGFEVRVKSHNPNVKDRVNAVNKAFESKRLFVNHRACPTVADCLEKQCYNKNNEPDKDSGYDHMNDATGYVVAYEMPVKKPVANINFKFA